MADMSLFDLLKQFCDAPGAPGCEDAVRGVFRTSLHSAGETDRLGNLFFAHGNGAGPRIMLTAHMDEIALMVHSIAGDGLLRIVPLGGWWAHTMLSQPVNVFTARGETVPGVIASKPPHLLSAAEREKVLAVESLLVDVGAINGADARERLGIAEGDVIVPDSPVRLMAGGERAVGKAMDNRVGCTVAAAVMQRLAGMNLPNELWCVATVQEELGCRGAITACNRLKPDLALVLEGPPADDLPGTAADEMQGRLGGGPQLRMMDPTALSNRRLVQFVQTVARESDIPVQTTVRRSGGTDAKSIHISGEGVPAIVIGVPARYIHSHNSIIALQDLNQTVDLVAQLIRGLDVETVSSFTSF